MISVVKAANTNLHPIVAAWLVEDAIPIVITGDRECRCWLSRHSPLYLAVLTGASVDVADADIEVFRRCLLYGHVRTSAEATAEAAAVAANATKDARKSVRTQDLRDIKARIKAKLSGDRTRTEKDTMSIIRFILGEEE